MTFGDPQDFAIHIELLEASDDRYWLYGIFFFIIDDVFYPPRATNWTLNMTINHLKETLEDIENSSDQGYFLRDNIHKIITKVAHSHHKVLASDPIEFEIEDEQSPIGAFLTPLEQQDTGFYLFYYPIDEQSECLIFSTDFGLTSDFKILKKGTVSKSIRLLPETKVFSQFPLQLYK